ncbi:MAG TPA: thymidine phosphorylase, partial [Burkholderiaceae bacterium]|nr:thymidine phosphorylase [Burkholderiaceae bacterium]
QMVVALGGPADLMERPQAYLPAAPVVKAIPAPRAGVLSGMKTRDIGLLIVEMGGGRRVASDAIDFRVGLSQVRHVGAALAAGEPLALVHAVDEAQADRVIAAYQAAVSLAEPGTAVAAAPIVMDVIG